MRKKCIFITFIICVFGLASQTIFAKDPVSLEDFVKITETYIDQLKDNGSVFEEKEAVLSDKKVQKTIKETLHKLMTNDSKDHDKILQASQKDDDNFPLITIKTPKDQKEPSEKEFERISDDIQDEVKRQKNLKLPAYVVQPGDQLKYLADSLSLRIEEIIYKNRLKYLDQKEETYPKNIEAVDVDKDYPLIVGDLLIGILPDTQTDDSDHHVPYKDTLNQQDRVLIGIQNKAINTIQSASLNLSPNDLQSVYDQIYLAQSKEEIDNIVDQALNQEVVVVEPTIVEDTISNSIEQSYDIEYEKTSAVNKLIAYNITQEQYNHLVAEVRSCQTSSDIQAVMNAAQAMAEDNQATESTETMQDTTTSHSIEKETHNIEE